MPISPGHAAAIWASISFLFYWRRAKRLLPASWLMTISMIVAAMFFATDALPGLRFDAIASFFYVTNWGLIWHSTSYFEAMGRPPLLLHLWSLAIEEQFYILWAPIVLFGMHKLGRRGLAVIAATLAIAAAAWMAILATKIGYPGQGDPSRLYFGPTSALGP
jgi:peptidoglycan/LPS O-acetylase OafA/YrhL